MSKKGMMLVVILSTLVLNAKVFSMSASAQSDSDAKDSIKSGTHNDASSLVLGNSAERVLDAGKNELPDTTLSNRIPGDANGDGKVNIQDALLIRQHLAQWNVNIILPNADVNANGKVDITDALIIRQFLANWNVTLKKGVILCLDGEYQYLFGDKQVSGFF